MVCEKDCKCCEKVKEYCEKKNEPTLYDEWQAWRTSVSEVGIEEANEEAGFNKDGSEKQ